MKGKFLIYAGLLAAAVGCTKESLVPENSKADRGITFSATLAEPATKGEYGIAGTEGSYTYPFSWMAEWDHIRIYADNAANPDGHSLVVTNWRNPGTGAEYKTTAKGRTGYFTAVSDADMLYPVAAKNNGTYDQKTGSSNFVATYNAELVSATQAGSNAAIAPNPIIGLEIKVSANNEQKVTIEPDGRVLYADAAPMVSVRRATYESGLSVGEQVPLTFYRVVPGLAFTTKGVNAELAEMFGSLNSIAVTAMGYVGNDEAMKQAFTGKESKLAYSGEKTISVELEGSGIKEIDYSQAGADVSKAKMSFENTAKAPWTDKSAHKVLADGEVATMMIAPVNRKAYRDAGIAETVGFTYEYEKITFVVKRNTANDWEVKTSNLNGLIAAPALNMAEYKYLVLKNEDGTYETPSSNKAGCTLVILEGGKIADALNTAGTQVKWNYEDQGGTAHTTVALDAITSIVSYANLGEADLKNVAKFKNLTSLTLKEDTTLPANMFAENVAAKLETLVAPKVKGIASNVAGPVSGTPTNFTALKELNLNAYTFPTNDMVDRFFKGTKGTLTKLWIEGVESMAAIFDEMRTLSLEDFTKLTTVALNPKYVKVSAKAFKGCYNLKTVTGVLDISEAEAAFQMSDANPNEFLSKVTVTGTVVPNYTFQNCAVLKDIIMNGAQLKPTVVGEFAFHKCLKLEAMDLTNTTRIGKYGFSSCPVFIGNASATSNLTKVGVAVVEESIFGGTQLVNVEFTNATLINPDIFRNSSTIRQIQFDRLFSAVDALEATWQRSFGKSENVDVFVADGQSYRKEGDNTHLYLPVTTDKGVVTKAAEVIFKSVQKLK